MPEERCPACGGLGAVVERYWVKDEDGYEFEAMRDVPCGSCNGTGRVNQ
jgi:RecJ-like exonuclease